MLKLIMENMTDQEEIVSQLSALALRHVEYGVEISHYNEVGVALLHVIEQLEGESWNKELEEAWRLAYTLIATTMTEAARKKYMERGKMQPSLNYLMSSVPPSFYHFNQEFQSAVEDLWINQNDGEAWSAISKIASDFEDAALNIAKLIIMERFLPESARTIKEHQTKGVIGGAKYLQHGIFFKLALPDGKFINTYEGG